MADAKQHETPKGQSQASRMGSLKPGPRMNALFRLALVPSVLFIVTVLGFTATQFGAADAPIPRWLSANVGWLIAVEVAGSVLLATMAMAVDRRENLSKNDSADSSSQPCRPTVTAKETRV